MNRFRTMRSIRARLIVIATLVIVITILHLVTIGEAAIYHIIYREFYYLPLVLAGLWFGLRGGLLTGAIVSVIYITYLSFSEHVGVDYYNGVFQVLLFMVTATLLGWVRDREISYQNELGKAESLAAVGRAVSSIAHDMKTPLMAIGGFAMQLRRKAQDDSTAVEKLDIILHQTDRLEGMIKDMLAFSRPLDLHLQPTDLGRLIRDTLRVAEKVAETHRVQLKIDLTEPDSQISLDPSRFQQALLNLITNAVEASQPDQTILIRTRMEGGRMNLEVIDHGEGIPPEKLDDIYTPFFTTKKEGTGLGLPMVKKIVEAHGGKIWCQNNPGGGTIFVVSL